MTGKVLALILAGGVGERLWPLTKDRSKPAVPFAGFYRLIDFPLSNCLNSRLFRIILLTQHKSLSLDRHIIRGWNIFPAELGGYIQCIPAQGRFGEYAYKGTADAVFQNIYSIQVENPEWVLILSGDHVYRMDYRPLLAFAADRQADAVVVCQERAQEDASRFGVVHADDEGRIIGFLEKPSSPPSIPDKPGTSFISMGVYLFPTTPLVKTLIKDGRNPNSDHDFGKNVIPSMIDNYRVFAYPFRDYWEDIGTIDSYFEASMAFLEPEPPVPLRDPKWPIRTLPHQSSPAFLHKVQLEESLIANGASLRECRVTRSIISPEVVVESGAVIRESILFDRVRVGRGAKISRAIIDKDAVIPDQQIIGEDPDHDRRDFTVTDQKVTVVPKEWRF